MFIKIELDLLLEFIKNQFYYMIQIDNNFV